MSRRRIPVVALATLFALSLCLNLFLVIRSTPTPHALADDQCQTFPQTGHAVCGKFLFYWQSHGGLAQQGYPISDPFQERNAPPPAGDGNAHTVQYFERARFEDHPENQPPYDVLLGLLGSEQVAAKYPNGFPTSSPTAPTTTAPPIPPTAVPSPPTTTPPTGNIGADGCLPAISTTGDAAQACMSDPSPSQYSTETVYGRLIVQGQVVSGRG